MIQGNGITYAVACVYELDINRMWQNTWNSNDHLCLLDRASLW